MTLLRIFIHSSQIKKLSIVSGTTNELIHKVVNRELTIAYVTELENEQLLQDKQVISEMLSQDKLVFAGKTKGISLQKNID